jgi:hypothetical protein
MAEYLIAGGRIVAAVFGRSVGDGGVCAIIWGPRGTARILPKSESVELLPLSTPSDWFMCLNAPATQTPEYSPNQTQPGNWETGH